MGLACPASSIRGRREKKGPRPRARAFAKTDRAGRSERAATGGGERSRARGYVLWIVCIAFFLVSGFPLVRDHASGDGLRRTQWEFNESGRPKATKALVKSLTSPVEPFDESDRGRYGRRSPGSWRGSAPRFQVERSKTSCGTSVKKKGATHATQTTHRVSGSGLPHHQPRQLPQRPLHA